LPEDCWELDFGCVFNYFAFATITTVGYGDVLPPRSDFAQIPASASGVIWTFLPLALVMGLLIEPLHHAGQT